jgi:hypothetical protein
VARLAEAAWETAPTEAQKLHESLFDIEDALVALREKHFLGTMRVTTAVNVDRADLLRHASAVFERFVGHEERLAIKFKDEDGFDADSQGMEAGVTGGFYSAVAERLQRTCEYAYEHNGHSSTAVPTWVQETMTTQPRAKRGEFLDTTGGLHPAPWALAGAGASKMDSACSSSGSSCGKRSRSSSSNSSSSSSSSSIANARLSVLERFRFIGRLFATGLRDGFTVPLPVSVPFLALAQGRCDLSAASLLAMLRAQWGGGAAAEAMLPSWLVQLAAYEHVAAELDALDARVAAVEAAGDSGAAVVLQRQGRAAICGAEFAVARLGLGAGCAMSFDAYVGFEHSEVTFVDQVDPLAPPLPWPLKPSEGEAAAAAAAAALSAQQDRRVTVDNVREFASALRERYLGSGVAAQVSAFRAGVRDFVSLDCLSLFTPVELSELVSGAELEWTEDSLRRILLLRGAARADGNGVSDDGGGGGGGGGGDEDGGGGDAAAGSSGGGYTWSDPTIQFLVAELLVMGRRERRRFLQFVTSSPTVPLGPGFRIEVTNFGDSPVIRVHTCMANGGVLHLPAYKTREELRQGLGLTLQLEKDGGFFEWRS